MGPSPFWQTRKAIWRHLWSIQNEAIPLVAMRWQRIVISLGKSCHCQAWLERRFSWNENLQRRKNWTSKSTILKENAKKVESVFVIRSSMSRKPWIDVALNIAGVTLGKLAIAVNLEALRLEFWTERSVSDDGNLCPLWSVTWGSVWNSVKDPFYLRCSWPWVVCCELYFTRCCAVNWTGIFASESKVLCLSDFKK